MIRISCLSAMIMLVDQIIKIIVEQHCILYQSIKIIPTFFSITYVQNLGAAFSILIGNQIFLIILSFIIIFVLYYWFIRNKKLKSFEYVIYGMLIGGILGNLVDRIFRGYVVDYLDFNLFGYDFPIFNLADIFIVISSIFLFGMQLRGEKDARS